MPDAPDTRDSLLLRLRDADDAAAWDEFTAIYRPMVYRLAIRRGLQPSDADDLAQAVLFSVSRAIGSWERDTAKSGFRSWLRTVARNAIYNHLQRNQKHVSPGGTDFMNVCNALPSRSEDLDAIIDDEYTRSLFRFAARKVEEMVQQHTWQAFWQTTMEGQPISNVAKTLGLSKGQVYGARSRVMRLLQQTVQLVESEQQSGE